MKMCLVTMMVPANGGTWHAEFRCLPPEHACQFNELFGILRGAVFMLLQDKSRGAMGTWALYTEVSETDDCSIRESLACWWSRLTGQPLTFTWQWLPDRVVDPCDGQGGSEVMP